MPSEDEARNVAPRSGEFWIYLAVVSASGISLILAALLRLTGQDFLLMGGSFVAVAALLVLTELRPLMTSGSPDASGVSTSTAFVFALLIHWGLAVALLMQAVATILADLVRQRAPWRTAFNVAQYALSLGAAASVLSLFGRHPTPQLPMTVDGAALPALGLAAVAYYVVNNGLVSGALSVRDNSPLVSEFFAKWRYQLAANGALLGLAPMVVLVIERGPALVPLLVLPLTAVYATAAMSLERERQALHDTLTGLPNRKLLVLLDNCEHLVDACAQTVDSLLNGCPGLYVLATSREQLRIAHEVRWQVPSLGLPDERSSADAISAINTFVVARNGR